MQGKGLGMAAFNVSLYLYLSVSVLWSMAFSPLTPMCVASGEDMAYEHVHYHPAGMHCDSVGSKV